MHLELSSRVRERLQGQGGEGNPRDMRQELRVKASERETEQDDAIAKRTEVATKTNNSFLCTFK